MYLLKFSILSIFPLLDLIIISIAWSYQFSVAWSKDRENETPKIKIKPQRTQKNTSNKNEPKLRVITSQKKTMKTKYQRSKIKNKPENKIPKIENKPENKYQRSKINQRTKYQRSKWNYKELKETPATRMRVITSQKQQDLTKIKGNYFPKKPMRTKYQRSKINQRTKYQIENKPENKIPNRK